MLQSRGLGLLQLDDALRHRAACHLEFKDRCSPRDQAVGRSNAAQAPAQLLSAIASAVGEFRGNLPKTRTGYKSEKPHWVASQILQLSDHSAYCDRMCYTTIAAVLLHQASHPRQHPSNSESESIFPSPAVFRARASQCASGTCKVNQCSTQAPLRSNPKPENNLRTYHQWHKCNPSVDEVMNDKIWHRAVLMLGWICTYFNSRKSQVCSEL
jgi:hypothetical protein